MQQEVFEVKRERFHLLVPNRYLLQGNIPKESEVEAYLAGERLSVKTEDWENNSALERFQDLDLKRGRKVTVTVTLPERLPQRGSLKIYYSIFGKQTLWFSVSAAELGRRMGKPQYFIEEEKVLPGEKSVQIRGWTADRGPVRLKIYDEQKQRIPADIQWNQRVDVAAMYKEADIETKCGFFVELREVSGSVLYLVFQGEREKAVYPVPLKRVMVLEKKVRKYVKKGQNYLRSHGTKALIGKVGQKIRTVKNQPVNYQKWIQRHLPSEAELRTQREKEFPWTPKISVVVPLYKTPEKYLRRLVESLQAQTYGNWELCLSDGSGQPSPLAGLLETLKKEEPRIRVISHSEALQISENTNAAIAVAEGEFIAFADHDDELTPNALYECVRLLNENSRLEMIYSDEDKMSMDGNKFFQPHFKPDFNLDLLCTVNYICHLFVVRKSLTEKTGLFRTEYDGAQDYDFIFRCVETSENIVHIPRILYHWRSHENSTAENPESKRYAFDAGERAVQAHYDRLGIPAKARKGEYLGLYRTKYCWPEQPLISILIPNKDHIDDLKRCMESIEKKSTYRNFEFVIIENNSEEQSTFAYYEELKGRQDVKVVYYDGPFNFSKINNFGVPYAKGEYLLLLNNDTEIINEDCLEELLGYCMRPDVGAVGARLYYEDDTIQHAGVVIGFGGIAGHCFVQQPRGTTGYCHRIICAQDYSAVTAACMMVRRSVYEEVHGMTEALAVAFNDIDFCMKIGAAGYRVVYNPYAELYHYESKSRGLEDTPEKKARFNREMSLFNERWSRILENGDPYYNPNLTLESQDFSLKRF